MAKRREGREKRAGGQEREREIDFQQVPSSSLYPHHALQCMCLYMFDKKGEFTCIIVTLAIFAIKKQIYINH